MIKCVTFSLYFIFLATRMIGEVLVEQGKFSEALEHHTQYLDMARTLRNAVTEQRALATLGWTYLTMSQLDPANLQKALKYSAKCLKAVSRIPSKDVEKGERSQMTGRAQENIGKINWRLGSSVEAEKSFSEAEKNFQGHRDAAGEQEHHLHGGHLLHGLCLLLPPDQGRGKYPFSEKVRTSKVRPTFSAASLTCLTLSPSRAPVSLCQNLSFDVRK